MLTKRKERETEKGGGLRPLGCPRCRNALIHCHRGPWGVTEGLAAALPAREPLGAAPAGWGAWWPFSSSGAALAGWGAWWSFSSSGCLSPAEGMSSQDALPLFQPRPCGCGLCSHPTGPHGSYAVRGPHTPIPTLPSGPLGPSSPPPSANIYYLVPF